MGSNIDLRRYQNSESIEDAFSRMVSGKLGYKTIIERRPDVIFCPKCNKSLGEETKFCPDCGSKASIKYSFCPKCRKGTEGEEKFCMGCGSKLRD